MNVAKVVGIIVGIILLIGGIVYSLILGAAGTVAGSLGETKFALGSAVGVIIAIGFPLIIIVGGALAKSKPKVASFLLGLSGLTLTGLGVSAGFDQKTMTGGIVLGVIGLLLLLCIYLIWRDMRAEIVPAASNPTDA